MIQIYEDSKRNMLLKTIHFGEVEAGDSKTMTIFLYNDSRTSVRDIRMKFNPDVKGLEIVSAPESIGPNQGATVKLKWSPSKDFKKALNTAIEINGKEVYVAE
jgi:hypothetical protein